MSSVVGMPATIVLARHGETDWNRDGRFQGQADPPLNDRGREQAEELAERLSAERFAALYASPLRRARETADIVAARLGLAVEPVDELQEIDVGSWSGLTRDEVASRFPAAYRRWLEFRAAWGDGETYDDLTRRVVAAVLQLAAAHPEERVLIVTHGGPIRAVLATAEGVSYAASRQSSAVLANCAVAEVGVENGVLRRLD